MIFRSVVLVNLRGQLGEPGAQLGGGILCRPSGGRARRLARRARRNSSTRSRQGGNPSLRALSPARDSSDRVELSAAQSFDPIAEIRPRRNLFDTRAQLFERSRQRVIWAIVCVHLRGQLGEPAAQLLDDLLRRPPGAELVNSPAERRELLDAVRQGGNPSLRALSPARDGSDRFELAAQSFDPIAEIRPRRNLRDTRAQVLERLDRHSRPRLRPQFLAQCLHAIADVRARRDLLDTRAQLLERRERRVIPAVVLLHLRGQLGEPGAQLLDDVFPRDPGRDLVDAPAEGS